MLHGYLTAAEKLAVPDVDILTDVDVKLSEDNGIASAQARLFRQYCGKQYQSNDVHENSLHQYSLFFIIEC